MGKQEAISKGYTACSRCGGKSSGTITVTYKKQVEVDGTTKNVWGAIGLSVLCTPLAYGFIYASPVITEEQYQMQFFENTGWYYPDEEYHVYIEKDRNR